MCASSILCALMYAPSGLIHTSRCCLLAGVCQNILSVCEPLVSVPVHVCMQYIKARPISIAGACFLVGSVCFH